MGSRMEQTEKEWLSNHPNHFLLFPPTILLHAPAVLLLWASQNVFGGGVFWGGGRVRSLCYWPLGWEDRKETLGPLS